MASCNQFVKLIEYEVLIYKNNHQIFLETK